jgi:hypothetical protein
MYNVELSVLNFHGFYTEHFFFKYSRIWKKLSSNWKTNYEKQMIKQWKTRSVNDYILFLSVTYPYPLWGRHWNTTSAKSNWSSLQYITNTSMSVKQ